MAQLGKLDRAFNGSAPVVRVKWGLFVGLAVTRAEGIVRGFLANREDGVVGSWAGLVLLTVGVAQTPPELPPLGLTRGDLIPYAGEVTDTLDKTGRVSKRTYRLDVKLFVLDVAATHTDCAILTLLTPLADADVVTAAANVTGTAPTASSPALARLDRLRVDQLGRVTLLPSPDRPPPFPVAAGTSTRAAPFLPLEGPCPFEWGMLVPRPEKASATWALPEKGRADCLYTNAGSELRNGGLCNVVTMYQSGPGWEDFNKVAVAWKRTERIALGPTDGLARAVTRTVLQREGKTPARTITTSYEMKAGTPMVGASYRHVRKEIEYAAWANGTVDTILSATKPDLQALEQMGERLRRFAEEHRPATEFRPAVEAAQHRVTAVLKGAPR